MLGCSFDHKVALLFCWAVHLIIELLYSVFDELLGCSFDHRVLYCFVGMLGCSFDHRVVILVSLLGCWAAHWIIKLLYSVLLLG